MRAAVPATREAFRLAEGPIWDSARRRVLWVDVLAGTVYQGLLDGHAIEVVALHHVDGMVSAVAVAPDGTLLVAAQERLIVLRPDGTQQDGPRIVPSGENRRLNDAGTDPAGRFLVGTLCLDAGSGTEVLTRLETDGRLTELDKDLTLSNGLAWSTDGSCMYSVDTLRRTVFMRGYEPSTGAMGERQVFVQVENGLPDGIAVDADDHVWVAVWGAGLVRRYAPDGSPVEQLSVPAPHTSSVAFAGEDLRTLVVTTATVNLSAEQLHAPDSGRLFTARVDVEGAPVPPWCGHPLPLPAST